MKVLGLTGGIACGKGTVSRLLAELGAVVIDADAIGHEVIAPGKPAWRDVVGSFGESILREDGTVDRKKLAEIVFGDADARRKLNAITHPRIAQEIQVRLADLARSGHETAIVEAALIGEADAPTAFDAVIVVDAQPSAQIARLIERDGFSEEAARRRVEVQMPATAKMKQADYVIDNSGSIERTREQVEALWRKLTQTAS